jgi:sugar-specific transcriptional regulator TrmB
LKSLASEVNMYESHIDEYKYEIDKLNRQLTEVRQKYFLQKKKEAINKERDRIQQQQELTTTMTGMTLQQPPSDLIQPNRSKSDLFVVIGEQDKTIDHDFVSCSDQARFTGGGFNLKSTPKPSSVTA